MCNTRCKNNSMQHYHFHEKHKELLGFIETEPLLHSLLSQMKTHHLPTYQHILRAALVVEDLAERLGFDPEKCYQVKKGMILHDMGKLRVPTRILDARVRPEGKDWEIMKNHVALTRNILLENNIMDRDLMYIALAHHEFQTESYPRQARKIWFHEERRSLASQTENLAELVVVSDKLDASLYRKDQQSTLTPREKILRDFTGNSNLVTEVMKYAA